MTNQTVVNRTALLGGGIASLGFFLLPLLELKPNRLASGIPLRLLQLEGGGFALAVLAVLPLLLAFLPARRARGWGLAGLGNALLVLTLLIPALAGTGVLGNAEATLGEVRVSNPRLLPSVALALGLLGGYMVLAGGLQDLFKAGVARPLQQLIAWAGVVLIALGFLTGQFDVYSVVVELGERGDQLLRSVIEHVLLVSVALGIGVVIGVGLGLWASRAARVAPLVLYTVGIIQTVPSLALFGALLVPLARLGDQRAGAVGLAFLALLIGATALILLYRHLARSLPSGVRQAGLLLCAIASALPLALFVVVASSLLFRASALAFSTNASPYPGLRLVMGVSLLAALGLGALSRTLKPGAWKVLSRYSGLGSYGVLATALLVALVLAAREVLGPVTDPAALTVRDLGVSGIGSAPAVVALTLYALLPLVRNTYAGLKGVDPAVTDAGRGVGMTPRQRFFQLELPLALPVIVAGVRNAGVALVGIATVASLIGAGGLGDFILGGIVNISIDQILLGTLPAVLLALLLDAAIRGVGRALTPPGICSLEGEGS